MPYKDKQRQREYQATSYRRKRELWIKENGPCVLCGSDKDLQVDHINPEEKVSHRIWSWSVKRRMAELSKCQVLCLKCHKEKSALEVEAPHGTNSRYTSPRWRCRCGECTKAHMAADREWKLRNR